MATYQAIFTSVCILDQFIVLNSRNLPYCICFWGTPLPLQTSYICTCPLTMNGQSLRSLSRVVSRDILSSSSPDTCGKAIRIPQFLIMSAMAGFEIKDGEYTKTIYAMIKEQRLVFDSANGSLAKTFFLFMHLRYIDAIQVLSIIYDSHPTSRASLSLLAYCYFYTQVRST